MDNPLVSIVIPAYKPDFFQACLDSALSQTYSNIEVIVSDDCPMDGIFDIVTKANDARVRYYRNTPAYGPALNYVESCGLAQGEYIKYLNDDDLLHPECLQRMVPYLEDEEVKLVTSYRQEVNVVGQALPDRLHNQALFQDAVLVDGKSLAAATLRHQLNFIGEPSCFLFRKKDVSQIKPHLLCFEGYGYEKSGLGDVGLQLNLLKQGGCVYIGGMALSQIRVFENQWQQSSGVHEWSMSSWKKFQGLAIASQFLSKNDMGWRLKYRSIGEKVDKQKLLISYQLMKHQLGSLYRSL